MITLAQSNVGRADKVEQMVIQTFIEKSEILELLPFANDVSPNGGSTLTYGYVQEKTPSTAAFRAIGQEYTPAEATVEEKTVTLAVFGGSFQIDRVIKTIEGQLNNMAFQLRKKITAAVQLFHDTMINGDKASNSLAFDGLDKMLVGTENEFNTDTYIDLSTDALLTQNASAFYEALMKLINESTADAILVNGSMKAKIETVARKLGYYTRSEQAFGRKVTYINDVVRIIDMGNKFSVGEDGETVTKSPIIGIQSRTIGEGSVTGLTDIYAVYFNVNEGFCGVSLTGDKVVDQYLPDFSQPGALKSGEVEMVACVALKNTNNAGVLRNIKIA